MMYVCRLCGLAVLTMALAYASEAQGGLIKADWKVPGDNALVRDTNTGLEWLDLIKTRGLSYNAVSANLGAGGLFNGFHYASRADVRTFFADAAIPNIDIGFGGSVANRPSVGALIALWEADLWQLNDANGKFGYLITAEVPAAGTHDTGLLWLRPAPNGAEATTGGQRGGAWTDNEFRSFFGSALVRQASPVVPEPATLTLLGFGAAGLLGYVIRRRGAQA